MSSLPGISLHFLSLHFRFSSLHFLERPSFALVHCSSRDFNLASHFTSLSVTSLQFSSMSLRFQEFQLVSFRYRSPVPFAFCTCILHTSSHSFSAISSFASPACIASFGSSGMMLVLLGVLSSIRHHLKSARFVTLRGDATKMLENRLNQSANPSPLIRAGPAQNVCSWSAHGPFMVGGMGRTALYLKVSPAGLACGPITSGHSQPATGHPFPFFHFLSLQVL